MICRPMGSVIGEVENLVAGGTGYVTLLGQTVDAWRHGGKRFCDLLEAVSESAPRVWFTTSHPSNMEDRTLRAMGERDTIVKRLHLPVQSGSDRMLKVMHRGYKAERYRRKIEVFREAAPGGTLSTDIIVGHPGETDEEFDELCAFVRWAEFDRVGVFRYSDEETSRSATLEGKVPERTAASRHRKLMTIQRKISQRKSRALIGRELEVLVEGVSDEHEYVLMGRHRGQAPDIDGQVYLSGGEARPGEIRRVRITQASDYDLVGELLDEIQRLFADQRRDLEQGFDHDRASTEDLRLALRRYRSFFDRLLSF